jgi:hypothetical protein
MTIEFSTDQDRLDVTMIHSFVANESYTPASARPPGAATAQS